MTTPMHKRRGFSVHPVFVTVPEGCAPARKRFLSYAVQILRKTLSLATRYLNCERAAILIQMALKASLNAMSIRIQNYSKTGKEKRQFIHMAEASGPLAAF